MHLDINQIKEIMVLVYKVLEKLLKSIMEMLYVIVKTESLK